MFCGGPPFLALPQLPVPPFGFASAFAWMRCAASYATLSVLYAVASADGAAGVTNVAKLQKSNAITTEGCHHHGTYQNLQESCTCMLHMHVYKYIRQRSIYRVL